MQPDRRTTPAARLVFGGRFRGVRGSLPRLSAWWRFAPVLFFLIGGPVFAQGDDPPAAPDIRRTFAGDRIVTLIWARADDPRITVYQIRYGPNGAWDPDWTDIEGTGNGTTGHAPPGLTNGIEYTFEVRAIRGSVEGLPARVREVPVPGAPVWVGEPAVGNGMVTLTWADPEDDAITGYQVRYEESGTALPEWSADHDIESNASTTDHVVAGLTNGLEYTIEVRAVAGEYPGVSASVTVMLEAPPAAPGNLTALSGDRAVTLTWDNSDAPDVARYEIRYGVGEAPAAWTVISVSPVSDASTTTREVPGLTNGIEYTIEVRAVAGAYPGAPASVTAMPGNRAPVNLDATIDNGTVVLTWEAPTADVESVTSYHFHYSLSSDGVNVMRHGIFGTPDVDTRTVDTIARERGYPYIAYKVLASRGEEFSDWSNTVTVMFHDGPPPPEGLNAAAGVGQVTLTWDDAENDALTGYQVRYAQRDAALPAWSDRHNITSTASTTSHTVTGLTDGTAYTFEVRAKKGEVDGAAAGVTQPAAPRNLSVDAGDASATLSWANPQDGAVIGYQVRYAQSSVNLPDWSDDHNVTTRTRHPVSGLTNGREYTFDVRAYNEAGTGVSDSATATPAVPACPALTISEIDNQTVQSGASKTVSVTATGGCLPITLAKKPNSGTPSWVSIEKTGDRAWTITISPSSGTTPKTYSAAVRATEARGRTDDEPFTITVSCPTLTLDPIADVDVEVNEGFTRTATARGGCDPIRITMSGAPSGVTIESGDGRTKTISSSGLSPEDTHTVTVTATDNRGTTARVQFDIIVDCPSISVSQSPTNPQVAVGDSVIVTAIASGGCGSHTFSNPSGLSWVTKKDGSNNQYVAKPTAGTPTGTHRFNVTATDDYENTGTGRLKVTVIPPNGGCAPFVVREIPDMKVTVDNSINRTASVTPACAAVEYSIENAPGNVAIDPNTGAITGSVGRTVGEYHVRVTAAERDNRENSDTEEFTITVVCAPFVIRTIDDMVVPEDTDIGLTASVIPACPTVEFSISGQPTGVGIVSDTGFIEGNVGPKEKTYDVTVTATDSKNTTTTDEEEFEIRVINPCESFALGEIDDVTATVCQPITAIQASASGGTPPYMYSLSTIPESGSGLSIGEESGEIIGTPTATGSFDVTVSVQDFPRLCTAKRSFTLDVECPDISVGGLPASVTATVNEEIDPIRATSSGGCGTMSYSIMDKPSWIRINGSTGEITGTPTEAGEFNVKVKATDGKGCAGMGSFSVTVEPALTVSCPRTRM